ncbi:MAG TPA: hypothetical protein VJ521_11490, partial [Acidobacteriota bacterium]|nr:hypothetical protein [Acidobacteriota bacterium]
MRVAVIALLVLSMLPNTGCSPALPSADSRRMNRVNYEFNTGLKRRGIQQEFQNYRLYIADLLEKSRGPQGSSEKTGKCRLKWVEELVRDPLPALSQAEQFTRQLFSQVKRESVQDVLEIAAKKLDLRMEPANAKQTPASDPMDRIHQLTQHARSEVQQAFRSLSTAEREKLQEELYVEATANATHGYRFGDKQKAVELIDLLERIDYGSLLRTAEELASLTESDWVKSLSDKDRGATAAYPHTSGEILDKRESGSCTVLLGGPGKNEYSLDEMNNVCAVIDVGGDDLYIEGSVTADRPVLLLVDLNGNDIYRGLKPAIQGSSIMGISLLWDLDGNDTYTANDVAQGSA